MKKKILLTVILLALATGLRAATNDLTSLLQQGLFDEEANHDLTSAIADYQLLATQFDRDRQVAATAIYRLGECYRKLGQTNEAIGEYQRILKEFGEQKDLVTLSQQNLSGLGTGATHFQDRLEKIVGHATSEAKASPAPDTAAGEAGLLSAQLSGLDQLKDDPEKRAFAVEALFPDDDLKQMLLGEQQVKAMADTNNMGEGYTIILSQITNRVDFIIGLQQARLQVLQSVYGHATQRSNGSSSATPTDEEAQEIIHIQQMIQNSPDLINAPDDHRKTPVERAAADGWLKVAAYLLDHGADVDANNNSGTTPLAQATQAGNRAMVELLLSRGADVNAKNSYPKPLAIAAEKNFIAVEEVLLTNKADVNVPTHLYNRENIPLIVATDNSHAKIVQMLLAAGADANTEDKDGRTALSYAAARGSPEMVKLLLAAKADPNGGTLDAPLLCAINKNDLESAELLLQAGANPNASGFIDGEGGANTRIRINFDNQEISTPLSKAISLKQLPMVQLLLKNKADPNHTLGDGWPLLFNALSETNILEALLDAGAIVDSVSPEEHQWTALAAAANQNDISAVDILLRHGANPNSSNRNGATVLHWAAYGLADPQIFKLLLAARGNPNVRSSNGKTPLDELKSHTAQNSTPDQLARASQLADLLRQHGAVEQLPDWGAITITRPAANFSKEIFKKGDIEWNHFSLFDLLVAFDSSSAYPFPLAFADLAHLTLVRPSPDGLTWQRLEINLLDSSNRVDCTKDLPLEFGDVLEMPEREHTLAENATYMPKDKFLTIYNYLRGKAGAARLVVAGGETVQLPLQANYSEIGQVLVRKDAQGALTSRSDLARVKVTRHDLKTGKNSEWILDCSHMNPNGGNFPYNNAPDLWLRDGDVIDVPELP